MKRILALQKIAPDVTVSEAMAISWSSCDSNSCNKTN